MAIKVLNKFRIVYILSFTCLLIPSCKKILKIDPPISEIIGDDIFRSDATATSAVIGIYSDMAGGSIFNGHFSISLRAGLSADELVNTTNPSTILYSLYTNSLTNNGNELFWNDLYTYIFRVNSALEGITKTAQLSTVVKKQLIAELKFLRGFYYFYLVNFYGDVPLILSTDIEATRVASRTPTNLVYEHIIKDLVESQLDISDNYISGDSKSVSINRVRPNKAAVSALLARVYLFTEQWELAEAESSKVITSAAYQLEDIDKVFLLASREAIWQLQPTGIGDNTLDARAFTLLAGDFYDVPGPNGDMFGRPVFLSNYVYDDFESDDLRKTYWVDTVLSGGITYPFSSKYKNWQFNQPRTEYLVVLRLSEQILIRAEARANLNKVSGSNSAESDINAIRSRAGLDPFIVTTLESALNEILYQRKLELFTEFGHRWLDLKRSGKIDLVMPQIAQNKGGSWQSYKALFPIPVEDILKNPSLRGHQNPGYTEN